jgi:heat shock protein HslJ
MTQHTHSKSSRFTVWLFVATSVVLVAACTKERAPAAAVAWPDTVAAEWVALSIFGAPVLLGSRVTVQTSPTGIGGYSGCNWYGMRRDTAARGVEMTARACMRPAGVMEQEQRLVSALTKGATAVRSGDTLNVRDSAGGSVLTLLRRRPTGSDVSQLGGTAWRLERSTIASLDTTMTIRFARDSVSGHGGCRDFVGTYGGEGDRLHFSSIAMVQMDCAPDARRRAEETLTTALSETSHFSVSPGRLVLTTWGGDTLYYAAAPSGAK